MDNTALTLSNQLYVVIGRRAATARLLDLAARLALRGPLLILDCGNQANLYPLARELRRLTHSPVEALSQIRIARAFTCFQVVALLEQTSGSGFAPQPVLVLDLLSTFYDESVSLAESRRLLVRCLHGIHGLRRLAPVLVSARPPAAELAQRQGFLDLLRQMAGQVWEDAPTGPEKQRQLDWLSPEG